MILFPIEFIIFIQEKSFQSNIFIGVLRSYMGTQCFNYFLLTLLGT